MDITQIYNAIIETLNNSEFEGVSADLSRLHAAAATGGEALESTGGYLFDLKKTNPTAFESVKKLIGEYLSYCKQNGIVIYDK